MNATTETSFPSPSGPARSGAAPFKRALVALDGRAESVRALRWVVDHGVVESDALRLVTVETRGVTRSGAERALAESLELSGPHREWLRGTAWFSLRAAPLVDSVADSVARITRPDDIVVIAAPPAELVEDLASATLPLFLAATSRVPVIATPASGASGAAPVTLLVGENNDLAAPLAFAVKWALAKEVPLRILHAWQVALGYPADRAKQHPAYDYLHRAAREILDDAARQATALSPTLGVETVLLEGPPARTLREALAGASLAVVGRRGGSAFRDVLLGSVAHELVAAPPCPIAVVPLKSWRGFGVDSEPAPAASTPRVS